MGENYTGTADDRRYSSEAVDVTYNLKRCIHAAECVIRLNEVFDIQKRPWIQPGLSHLGTGTRQHHLKDQRAGW